MRIQPRQRRTAAATVEFAVVCLPLFVLIFGLLELGRAFMVQELLNNAARAGARASGLSPNGAAEVGAAIKQALAGTIRPTDVVVLVTVKTVKPSDYPSGPTFGICSGTSWGSSPYTLTTSDGTAWTTSPTWLVSSQIPSGAQVDVQVSVYYSKVAWIATLWPDTVNSYMTGSALMTHE
jgi:Flp pilus assembly protein TadG